MSDPLYFLQQAFTYKNDKEHVAFPDVDEITDSQDLTEYEIYGGYEQYEEVTFNIYLFKGVHHFIQCTERLEMKHDSFYYDNLETIEQNLPTLCTDLETYFPIKRSFEASDNLKFYVKPLECKNIKQFNSHIFSKDDGIGKDAFFENCVDLEFGDAKP